MKMDEPIFPHDQLLQSIFEVHMEVVATSKGYFCMLFGHHDALNEAIDVFLREGNTALEQLIVISGERNSNPQLMAECHPKLRELLGRPLYGKKPSKAMMDSRISLLASCGLSAACFRNLEADEKEKAILAYGKAEYFLSRCIALGGAELGSGSISTNASLGAIAKLARDPKQKDKALVRDYWSAWQKEPGRYKSKSAFARDMLDKFESLGSQRVIERWCKDWESVPF